MHIFLSFLVLRWLKLVWQVPFDVLFYKFIKTFFRYQKGIVSLKVSLLHVRTHFSRFQKDIVMTKGKNKEIKLKGN